ncbi:hypothetical protein RI129_007572 [Pyrocoelia pectoralis]|uniref:Cuticle protein 6 n=1 Tax=Pyrocoelia pectoralis TaxID=417401 RepID=A0AAN7ZH57_9COLE
MVDGISKVERRTADGNVYGGYSFVDPNGIVRKTAYTSGVQGFHAVSQDIPMPVQDTPEVAIAKSQHLELLRGAHLANGQAFPISEKVIQSSVPLIRTGQLAIPENVENSVFKANSIALESIPLSPSASLLKYGPFAKESVPLSERIIKSQIPVFRISDLNLKSVPISREYFTEVPAFKPDETSVTQGNIESLVRLENPFLRIVDLPRSEIVLDPFKFAGDNVRIVRIGDEGFRKILLH